MFLLWTSLVAQVVKNLPAMREIWVRSLGWEDPLEEGMTTPLQYSCLENPMDRGAWRAAPDRVAQTQTGLKHRAPAMTTPLAQLCRRALL